VDGPKLSPVWCHCETSDRSHWLWQSVFLWICTGVLRMTLLRCPKFLRCLTADAGNFDRGHSLTSLHLPLAALGSLPTTSVRTGLGMTGCKECGDAGRCRHRPLRKRILWCVGEGLRPSRGRPQGSPLRRVTRNAVRNPPVTASPCQPPLGKGALGTGDADCHSQCAHWLRNDTL